MAVYTKLKKSEIKKLAKKFKLKVLNYAPVQGGACNSNYLLETNLGNYMMTLVEERNEEESMILGKLLLWLEQHQFKTTPLRKLKNGNIMGNFSGKPVLVKKYLSGKVIFDLNKKKLRQIGKRLGKLHRIPIPDFVLDHHYYEKPVFNSVFGAGIDPEFEKWLKNRLYYFEAHLPKTMPRGLIHGDVFADNVLFKKNRLKAIIDFEEACNYYMVYDLGMILIGLCSKGTDLDLKRSGEVIKGYQKIRTLEKEEINNLQLFTEYAAVRTSNWRYWKYHLTAPNPERAEKHREMMGLAEHLRKMDKKVFLEMVFAG